MHWDFREFPGPLITYDIPKGDVWQLNEITLSKPLTDFFNFFRIFEWGMAHDSVTPYQRFFPLSGIRYRWIWKKSNPARQRFQINVPLVVFPAFKFLIEFPWRYLEEFEKSFQMIFPPKVILARPGSLICKPPSLIGRLTVSQLTRWNFLWFPFPLCNKKSWIRLETCARIAFGAKRKEAW